MTLLLLERGADVSGADEVCRLRAGAQPRGTAGSPLLPPQNGATPLHWAVVSGKPEVATLLLEHGAELEAVDVVRACASPPRSQRSSGWALAPRARSIERRRCTPLQNGASSRSQRYYWNAVRI